jgi:four helix bundle protein
MMRLAVGGWRLVGSAVELVADRAHIYANGNFCPNSDRSALGRISPRRERAMNAIKTHKDLVVWQKAISLAGKVYAATRSLPSEERYGLNQQLRRSAVSIATNIAEGSARKSRAEFLQFLHIARGSVSEIETQVMIAIGQGYFEATTELPDEVAEVGRLLNGLIRSLTAANQTAHARACAPHHPIQ